MRDRAFIEGLVKRVFGAHPLGDTFTPLDESDIRALFIALRPVAPKRSTFLDIGDAIAHGDERDRGPGFTGLSKFVATLRTALEGGGDIVWPDSLYPMPALLDELMSALDQLGVSYDADQVKLKATRLRAALVDILDGTTVQLKDADVVVEFRRDGPPAGGGVHVTFPNGIWSGPTPEPAEMHLRIDEMLLAPNATFCSRLLRNDSGTPLTIPFQEGIR